MTGMSDEIEYFLVRRAYSSRVFASRARPGRRRTEFDDVQKGELVAQRCVIAAALVAAFVAGFAIEAQAAPSVHMTRAGQCRQVVHMT